MVKAFMCSAKTVVWNQLGIDQVQNPGAEHLIMVDIRNMQGMVLFPQKTELILWLAFFASIVFFDPFFIFYFYFLHVDWSNAL